MRRRPRRTEPQCASTPPLQWYLSSDLGDLTAVVPLPAKEGVVVKYPWIVDPPISFGNDMLFRVRLNVGRECRLMLWEVRACAAVVKGGR